MKRLLVALLFFVATFASAQSTGGITGVVTDAGGATVAGAEVKATNTATAAVRTVQTNYSGSYVLSPLPVGQYTIQVSKKGFKRVSQPNVVIDINSALTLNMILSVGDVSEEVTVTGAPPAIDTENQELGNYRLPEQIQNLPLVTREVQTLIGQTAGVPYGTGAKTATDTDTIGGTFSQHSRAEQQVLTDGAQLNPFQTTGYPAIDGIGRRAEMTMPNIDMVHEFRMVTNGSSAEYGLPVAIVVATKSGTNRFHGDLFEQYQSGGLSAIPALYNINTAGTPPPPASYVRHQYGGSFLGPIIHDKIFFAGAVEVFSHKKNLNLSARYPTDAERAGDLSYLYPAIQLYEPVSRAPIPNNRIDLDPNTPISPVTTALLAYIPHAPYAAPGQYNAYVIKPEYDRSQKYDARIDWTVTPKNLVFARTTLGHIDQASTYAGLAPGNYGFEVKNYWTQLITGTWTRLIGQSSLFRLTLTHRNNPFKNTPTYGDTLFPVPIANLTPLPPFAGPPAVKNNASATGISDLMDRKFNNVSDDNDWQINPSYTTTLRNHTIIAGVFFLHGEKTQALASPPWGMYTTSSDKNKPASTKSATGDAFSDMLLGYPSTTDVTVGPAGGFASKQNISAYIQDNWKLRSNLTINLGIRYDNYGFFRPQDDRFANSDVDNGKIIIPDDSFDKIQPAFQPFLSYFESASSKGLTNSLAYSNNYEFVPRIGVAYRFWQQTVLRGGFGIYTNDVDNNYFGDGINSPPFTYRAQLTRQLTHANSIPDNQYTFENPTANGSPAAAAGTLGSFGGWTANFPAMRAYEYSLTLEHQIGGTAFTVSYAGNYQQNPSRFVDINACVPGAVVCLSRGSAPDAHKFPQFGLNFGQNTAQGTSNYNAIYVEVSRRMHHGIAFDLNYAHARLFSYTDTATNPVAAPLWHYDYGPVEAQPYDIFHFNHVIELPFGHGRKFGANMPLVADLLAGGWKFSGVGTVQSGQPLTVMSGGADSPTSGAPNRANRVCNGSGKGPALNGPQTETYFNTACYTTPTPVDPSLPSNINKADQFGTAGVGTVTGPGVFAYDVNLQKEFRLPKDSKLNFRVDCFNVFNHPIISAPNTTVADSTYGHSYTTTAGYQPRLFQFGARYSF